MKVTKVVELLCFTSTTSYVFRPNC